LLIIAKVLPDHHGAASSASCQLDDHWCGFGGSFAPVPSELLPSARVLSPSQAVVSTVNTPFLSLHLHHQLLVDLCGGRLHSKSKPV
jgi:hypothetical protein